MIPEEKGSGDEKEELKGLDRVSMKKKLMKLDRLIQDKGEIKTKLQPNGLPFIEDHQEDMDFGKEHSYIMRTLKKTHQ